MQAGLNIAAVSRRTGVPADTLRKWEQRYGALQPKRTAGGQRRYSEIDVARVEWLRDRIVEGLRIGEAAALLGGGGIGAAGSPGELRQRLYGAAAESDVQSLRALLERAFTVLPLEQTLTRVLEPVLARIGEGWVTGEVSVAQEHLVSAAIRARLEAFLADTRGGVRGVAVLACVPGERHELGLLMLGTLLRADGWQVAFLGADAPLADTVELAEGLGATMLCLSATMSDNLRAIGRQQPPHRLVVVLGGSAASERAARRIGALSVDRSLRRSVRELRRLAR